MLLILLDTSSPSHQSVSVPAWSLNLKPYSGISLYFGTMKSGLQKSDGCQPAGTLLLLLLAVAWSNLAVQADDAVHPGFRFLTETPLIPPDFDDETFNEVWREWPEDLRKVAEGASIQERRKMAFERYGLTTRPDDSSGKPLQYTVGTNGGWSMNCFTCHGGTVYGDPLPGSPNNRIALQSLIEETFQAKLRLGKTPSRMDVGAMVIPLGTTNGTTNAVVFGMGLMDARDTDLNVIMTLPKMFTHHDMDAPPWWTFHKRPHMYIDGFAEKGHRGLMQFTLVPENGPSYYRKHEAAFADVLAYIESLRPPAYPEPIDSDLKRQGQQLFEDHCVICHGTYEKQSSYPNLRIPLGDIGTDPVRLTALTVSGRTKYANSWFAHAGEDQHQKTEVDPDGYVAPPLDGIWASAPYLHNGSVPTLWHLLNPSSRPVIWRRTSMKMNEDHVGLTVECLDQIPQNLSDPVMKRSVFDTRSFGKTNVGHNYPDVLTQAEKRAVLEYLKSL